MTTMNIQSLSKCALRLRTAGLALLICSLFALFASAQSITTGDITGVVKDPTDAVVPNATVTLTSLDNGETRTATTGDAGTYRFSTLRPGKYQITVSASGLQSDTTNIAVDIGQVLTLPLIVKPSSSKQVVEVTDTAPLMQSDTANLATSYNAQQLENLPAPGNDMTAYAFHCAGRND